MRWTGHVTRRGEGNSCRILEEKRKERDQLKDVVVDGRRILKWILNTMGGRLLD
jgi:hypothetical protein